MSLRKAYRPWSPDQAYLLPPSPREWLEEDDLAHFVIDVVGTLDVSAIEREVQRKDARGTRPYDPRMMLALLLYGYSVGVVSSRKIEQATYRDIAFRVIAAGEHPDHTIISEFRRRHLGALGTLFAQTVELAMRAGLVSLGRVALDGTKVQANASKHKAMSYDRMKKTQADLQAEVAAILDEAERVDAAEDRLYGRDRRGDELPPELRRRETRLQRIRDAKAALEREAAEARAAELRRLAAGQDEKAATTSDAVESKRAKTRAAKSRADADRLDGGDDDTPPPSTTELPLNRVPTERDGKPTPKAQRNFTDPDSRIMKDGGDFSQAYNAQAVVDEAHQLIVACGLTNQGPDSANAPPMLERVKQNCARYPQQLLCDNGYWNSDHIDYAGERGVELLMAPGRPRHGDGAIAPNSGGRRDEMRAKLETPVGKAAYSRRKAIVEPVFGQIKEARRLRRFLLRGLTKVQGEWALWCATHNLLKLYRAGWAAAVRPGRLAAWSASTDRAGQAAALGRYARQAPSIRSP